MFNINKSEKKMTEELSNSSNIIGKGTTFEGKIEAYGNIRVEGHVVGNIITKSKVALGQSSKVNGDILAQKAEIAGEVKGSIEISDLLILKSSAFIHGGITTNKLIIEPGAIFNGDCKMGESTKEIKIGKNEQTKKLFQQTSKLA